MAGVLLVAIPGIFVAIPGIFVAIPGIFVGIGINRAYVYAKAQRQFFQTLIADPAPAAASALWLLLAYGKLPAWKRALSSYSSSSWT